MSKEGPEFYCPKCKHQWKITLKEWTVLAKSTPYTLPKCPKCGYDKPALVGKEEWVARK